MRLVLIGAGGHGRVCAEIAEMSGYDEICFLDRDKNLEACGKYKVVGTDQEFCKFIDASTRFFISVGDARVRRCLQERVRAAGGEAAVLKHPNAVVSGGAEVMEGTVVMAGAVINPGAVVGRGVIVNTASSVDHDCRVSDYCHVAVGARLCGGVTVGEGSWIGAGAVVNNNVSICGGCTVGAGAVVIRNIDESGIYVGVPAWRK